MIYRDEANARYGGFASRARGPGQRKVLSLDDPPDIAAELHGMGLVLNCAGPFSKTANLLMRACLIAKTHYLDMTGEIDVLEGAHRLDADAKSAGVVVCPGVGFDVTPTDCIALMLKMALPEAHELALGFEADQRMSPGTAKTAIEALGKSGKIRRSGRISIFPSGVDVGRSILVGGQSWRCPFPEVTSPQPFTPRAFPTSRSSRQFLRGSWRLRD